MKVIDNVLMETLMAEAAKSPRRRAHYNLHASLEEPIHRLLVATMPDTVFPVHRHGGGKWELLTVLRGEIEVTVYEPDGKVVCVAELAPGGDPAAVSFPAGYFHKTVVKTPAVFLEVKPGPYVPIGPEDIADFV